MIIVFKKFNIVSKGTVIGIENPLLLKIFFEEMPDIYSYEHFEHLMIID